MKLFRAILSISLAALLLFSSSKFLIDIHLCGRKVQNVAMFDTSNNCNPKQNPSACHHHVKAHCCEDDMVIHKKSENFESNSFDTKILAYSTIAVSQPYLFISDIIPATHTTIPFKNYVSPKLSDVQTVLQVLLI